MGLFDFMKSQTSQNEKMTENVERNYSFGQDAMIISESMDLMKKTLNPSTFFSREKLVSNKAVEYLDNPRAIWNGMNCQQIYNMLNERYEMNMFHREFIDRLFEAGYEDRLTYQMYDVGYSMRPETREYFVNKLKGKKYHFVKVEFPESKKLYTYVTKDTSIKPGDTVTIPTGNEFVPESKVKQVVEVFEASLEELGFPVERLRCVEEKLKNIHCPNCGASIEVDVGEKTGKCKYCQAMFYLLQ